MSIRFFWTISPVQIYPSLQQLEEAGFVVGRDEPQGRRARRIYEVTKAGEYALQEWLERPDPMPLELRDVAMVRLFLADALEPSAREALVETLRSRSEERLTILRSLDPRADQITRAGVVYPQLTLQLGIAIHQAIVKTLDDFANDQGKQPSDP